MFKFIQKQLNNKKGFTLVELVVVIAILGILAAIAVPRLGTVRKDAANKANIATGRAIASAVSIYEAEVGEKPDAIGKLVPNYLDAVPKSAVDKTTEFSITYNSSGSLLVKIGDSIVYPEPITTPVTP